MIVIQLQCMLSSRGSSQVHFFALHSSITLFQCVDNMYSCRFCNHRTDNFKTFCAHAKSHRNLANYRFSCGIDVCPGNFRTFSSLKSHMHRNHMPAVSQKQNRCQHSGDLKCSVQACDYVADNFFLLCVHLRLHMCFYVFFI